MNHHPDRGSDSDFNDPGGWNKASYFDDPIDSIEPLPDAPNDYRQAAIYNLQLMFAVDEFLSAAPMPGLPLSPSPSHWVGLRRVD
jgi:hypothetical protein